MSALNGKGTILNNSSCFNGRGAYRSDNPYKRHFVNAAVSKWYYYLNEGGKNKHYTGKLGK